MINLNSYLVESRNDDQYRCNWQWFTNLITNVDLSRQQLENMFSNMEQREVAIWIAEIQDCYVGTDAEEEAMKMKNYKDMAAFFANHPVTM